MSPQDAEANSFGKQCKFSHDKADAPKTSYVKATEKPGEKPKPGPKCAPKPTPQPGSITAVMDDTFPSIEAVASPQSDALIFPLEARHPDTALRIIRGMEFSDRAPDNVRETETLIWVLAQSNAFNSGWVRGTPGCADDGPSRTARSCCLMSLGLVTYHLSYIPLTADAWQRRCATRQGTRLPQRRQQPHIQDQHFLLPRLHGADWGGSAPRLADAQYFTSEAVLKSVALSRTNTLFGILDSNLEQVLRTLKKNIAACMATGSFVDHARGIYGQLNPNGLVKVVSGVQVFKPVISMLNEYAIRFRRAPTRHPDLVDFVSDLKGYFEEWADKTLSGTSKDRLANRHQATRSAIVASVRKELDELSQRVANSLPMSQDTLHRASSGASEGLLAAINREYDGPGELSAEGPRHSNGEETCRVIPLMTDHVHIGDIEIPPTGDEMTAGRPPYLPINLAGAKHHLPDDSMAKM